MQPDDLQEVLSRIRNEARNAMHAVLGTLDLIAEGPLTGEQRNYLSLSKATAERLLRTISAATDGLHPAPVDVVETVFDIRKVLEEVLSLMQVLAAQKGLGLRADIEPAVPVKVIGDRQITEEVFTRVLDMMLRAVSSGDLTVRVSAELQADRAAVSFDVRRTAASVSEALWPSLDSVDSLTAVIVRKLVTATGGTVTQEADAGGRARLAVRLPLKVVPLDALPPQPVITESLSALKVLVAEDSDDSYFVLDAYLKDRGHRLTRAINGQAALEMAAGADYDLILMDVVMPVMDGYTATREIRDWETRNARARVPIVILSAEDAASQRKQGAAAGCSGYLTKPVRKQVMLDVLNSYARALSARRMN